MSKTKILVLLALLVLPTLAVASRRQPTTFKADEGRTVYVVGEIGSGTFATAGEIVKLSAASRDPITLIINSPGGSIEAGLQILSAMDVAKARGVKVRCFVPVLAASMAFQIFSQCDERYALRYSLLLFHRGRHLGGERGATADELAYEAGQLRVLERMMNIQLLRALRVPPRAFYYHLNHETLWVAVNLRKFSPRFLKLVDSFEGVDNPFTLE